MSDVIEFVQTPIGIFVAIVALLVLVGIVWLAVARAKNKGSKTPEVSKPEVSERPPRAAAEPAAPSKEELSEEELSQEVPIETVPEVQLPAEELATEELAGDFELEIPESIPGRMQRLRSRLAKSGSIGNALLSVFSRGDLSAADWEEIEETLLMADVGMAPTEEIMDRLRTEARVRGGLSSNDAREVLRDELLKLIGTDTDRSLNLERSELEGGDLAPAALLIVGVNGTGKTTTVGKLARLLRAEEKSVVLGAADTFRAAAAEQLTTWGDRVGVPVVSSDREGGDPASVAFEAVKEAVDADADVVIVDTAGRLQTKSTLMDELGKIKRVMEKQAPVEEVLLVLDATTGQNGMRQAQVFAEAVGITGIVLTKLDGSAKGGIVISVQRELGVPVKLVGLGEGPDDLAPFDPEAFVDGVVGE